MTGKTHLVASGILGAMVSAKMQVDPSHILVCMLGGILPDADHKNAPIGKYLPLWKIFKPHRRNLLHSFLGSFLLSLLIPIPSYRLLFFLGYTSHLVLDIFNRTGVQLFWPFQTMISVAKIKVGGRGELLVTFLFYMIVVAILSYW